jgi:two-component system CheB/CheR fusion protein
MTASETEDFERLLQYLEQTRGFDFRAYKRTTLMRRVLKRMQTVSVPTFDAYLDYLQVHQEEFAALFNTILINVTSFFRDEDVWTTLRDEIIPALVAARHGGPIRVWSAGCASGQEPYSLAMLFAEAIGVDAVRDRVKIYATDADEEALTEARAATYTARQVADIPEPLRVKYLEPVAGNYVINRDIRRAVIFGRHDLLQDAPISKVDLLLCRNTLMYFQAEAQARIVQRLYFALNPDGYAILGRAEMLFSHAALFTPMDLKRRVFRAVPKANHRDRLVQLAQSGRDAAAPPDTPNDRLRDMAFETGSVPQLLVDASGALAAVNGRARHTFHVSHHDIGRPIQDLEVSYRPAEVRGALDRAIEQRDEIRLTEIPWTVSGALRHFDVLVSPVFEDDRTLLGVRISFHDITDMRALQAELQHSRQALETAYEELQSTNEELETTNEELQSTVEELETTNEELQSANEELETMNEELQSTNEELQTMNDELRTRSSELNAANAYLESVFGSMASAVIVLDRELRVQVWNEGATELWGLRPDEAQQAHFLGLDIGLPVTELRRPIRDVLSGAETRTDVVVPATSRRGRSMECRVRTTALRAADRQIGGVILFMEDVGSETLA